MKHSKIIYEYNKIPLEKRKEEYELIMLKHPHKIPIVTQKSPNSKLCDLAKSKFLIPQNRTISFFMIELRTKLNLKSEQSLFVFINENTTLPMNATLKELHDKYKDDDGFLKIIYCEENTFG